MVGKYLSEVIDYTSFAQGELNIVECGTGSGKTYWSLVELPKRLDPGKKMLFLIDTANGRDQFLKKYGGLELYDYYSEKLLKDGLVDFESNISIATYAKFGSLARYAKNELWTSECVYQYIVCDEIHNLIRFSKIPSPTNFHQKAKERLEKIVCYTNTLVIGLTATPRLIDENFGALVHFVDFLDDPRRYETKHIERFSSVNVMFTRLKEQRGIIYFTHIASQIEFCEKAKQKGYNPIAIWSKCNEVHPMNEEQLQVREAILSQEAFPDSYDMLVINASSETGITISGKIDYIIVCSNSEDIITQVRGRYRGDLDTLYIYDTNEGSIDVPPRFMNTVLDVEGKKELALALGLKKSNRTPAGWTTVSKKLQENGYRVKEVRRNGIRCVIISKL